MWVVTTIVGAMAISAVFNALIHLIFKLTGGHMDDGD